MAKHRRLTKPRSGAAQTHYFGRVSLNGGAARQMHYIATGDGEHIEIMALLRKALDELEEYRFKLLAEEKQNGL